MLIKSILTLYNGDPAESNALIATAGLVKAFGGRARIAFFAASHVTPPYAYTAYQGSFAAGAFAVGASEVARADRERDVAVARVWEAASSVLTEQGLALCERDREPPANAEVATFMTTFADLETGLPDASRTADLLIASYDHRTNDDLNPILTALFRTGRPVVTVPRLAGQVFREGVPRWIVAAWDGSVSAARALREAIPLMCGADKVEIVTVGSKHREAHERDGEEVLSYLALHGVEATFNNVTRDGRTTGAALLGAAEAFSADMLVMGAYGHGHLAEMVLGGTTSHILKRTHLPLFLVH